MLSLVIQIPYLKIKMVTTRSVTCTPTSILTIKAKTEFELFNVVLFEPTSKFRMHCRYTVQMNSP